LQASTDRSSQFTERAVNLQNTLPVDTDFHHFQVFLQHVSIACYAEHYDRFCLSDRPSHAGINHAKTTPAVQLRSCGLHWRI